MIEESYSQTQSADQANQAQARAAQEAIERRQRFQDLAHRYETVVAELLNVRPNAVAPGLPSLIQVLEADDVEPILDYVTRLIGEVESIAKYEREVQQRKRGVRQHALEKIVDEIATNHRPYLRDLLGDIR